MIAADTSAWIDYSKGADTLVRAALRRTLIAGVLFIPLPVLFEVLSGPGLTEEARKEIIQVPRLEFLDGTWERAAEMRRTLLGSGSKARAMDSLVAQICIDQEVPLIASDRDYRHFTKFGLKLAL